jgi:glutaconate CoA-transferase, subunit B
MTELDPTPEEVMTIAAARELVDGEVVLVGVGPPNAAANLARRLDHPGCVLIYESGAIGARPQRLPLSIGDDDLAAAAQDLVSVPEMFNYWIGGGRIDVGFLGASQIDRFGNINTTVIGDYEAPKVRLPGAGGAPEIAASARRILVLVRQSPRSFVSEVDFVTSVGRELDGRDSADGHGSAVITDLGILRPSPDDGELELVALHPGVELDQVREATGWPLRIREPLETTEPVTERELSELRALRVSADEGGAPSASLAVPRGQGNEGGRAAGRWRDNPA